MAAVPTDKAAGLLGKVEVKKAQRRLPPELKERLMEALEIGIRSGFGYHNVWRMLRDNGVEVSRSTVRRYYYKRFPERLGERGPCPGPDLNRRLPGP